MEKNTFEWTCTGNRGRSEPSRLISLDRLEHYKLLDLINVISSGTQVDDIKSGRARTVEYMDDIINRAVNRNKELGIYTPVELDSLKIVQKNNSINQLNYFFQKATKVFSAEEYGHRQEMLKYFNITGELKSEQEQTIARPETIALFVMEPQHLIKVNEIYSGHSYKPEVIRDLNVSNTFGLGRDAYKAIFERLMYKVPGAVDSALIQLHI
ncbi:MAG: hypothetical protein KKF89_02465 [Nanoarchaeota archaeon]|nr:hypothetical protein [Nanoarchaeota archaeon]MBU1854557.1 hypothetical protein [Nanoarchaeota archaeon]